MKVKSVLRLIELCLILLEIRTVIPICLTWTTSNNYLKVECSVLFATHDIFIVDRFGTTRGQCIITDSWICSRTQTHDLFWGNYSDTLTKLTLKTKKKTAEGEWKCRHGNDERQLYVSYREGNFPVIDMNLSADTMNNNETNRFKLTCSSCQEPYVKGVDISINNVTVDNIRYEHGLCYHKQKLCKPGTCSCLSRGTHYTWIYISNLPFIKFTCAMRFKNPFTSEVFIVKAHVIYNESVIVQKQKTNESINHSDKTPEIPNLGNDMTHNSGYISIPVVAGVFVILFIILITCFWRIRNRRRKSANDKDKKNKDECIPLQDQNLTEPPQKCNGTETTDTYSECIKKIINVVSRKSHIDELTFFINISEQIEEYGFRILKGLGVEVEEHRVSFYMNKIPSLGEEQYRCLPKITALLFRGRSFRFLRLYDVGKFDLNDLQLNENVYNPLYKIIENIIEKSDKSWYHYRRNGLTYKGSSEGAFLLVKQVFMNKKSSSIFHQFSSFESRFDTFHDYPIDIVSYREKLAQAGFFYFGFSDYVQCHNCGGCLRDWQDLIDPLKRHMETFEICNFAMDPERKRSLLMDDGPVKYIGQQTYENRLNSFKSFPDTLSTDDFQKLAFAGFYYGGIAKDIECCSCNIEFSDIYNTQYILRQHKEKSPECPFTNKKCHNQSQMQDMVDKENTSFVQYLEIECRSHDFRFKNI